jgi:hypothetical protein
MTTDQPAPASGCIATIPGCPLCTDRATREDHIECDDLCRFEADLIRRSYVAHYVWHNPPRCRCGAIQVDRFGHSTETRRTCMFGRCFQYFCTRCRRHRGGIGPSGCPCDYGRHGHGTWAEFPRPQPPIKRSRRLSQRDQQRIALLKEMNARE